MLPTDAIHALEPRAHDVPVDWKPAKGLTQVRPLRPAPRASLIARFAPLVPRRHPNTDTSWECVSGARQALGPVRSCV